MKNKKLIFLLILTIAFSLTLTACGGGGDPSNPDNGNNGDNGDGNTNPNDGQQDDGEDGDNDGNGNGIDTNPSLAGLAAAVLNNFEKPDLWQFLPESLRPQNRGGFTGEPDYSSFTAVSSIPQNGMGAQAYMALNILQKAESILNGISTFYATANAVSTVYQQYINDNPHDYAYFSKSVAGLNIIIELDGEDCALTASALGFQADLYIKNGVLGGRIEVPLLGTAKFDMTENTLKVAVNIVGLLRAEIDFVRNDTITTGMLYEFAGTDSVYTTSAAHIRNDGAYTTFVGNKSDEIAVVNTSNVEVYGNANGKLAGTKIKSSAVGVTYNTRWFNLYNITGINNVKRAEGVSNGMNADTVYVNNSATAFATKVVGGLSLKTLSRRYDIEFKTMHFWEYNSETGKYEHVTAEIPMLFVQEENLSTASADIVDNNASISSINNTIAAAAANAVTYGYDTLIPLFDTLKSLVTPVDITAYIGTKKTV